jgi:serine/threonine protein kinase
MLTSVSADTPRLIAVGSDIGNKYRVLSCLGRGGMGEVVLARDLVTSRTVAIKILATRATHTHIARFLREARVTLRLESEHVVNVLDVGTLDSGLPYFVMDHLRGLDLGTLVGAFGPLSVAEAVTSILHASNALAEAHAMGIVHRDLKPQNLFLTQREDARWFVKVLDFGVSKISAEEEPGALTGTADVIGTPAYMSPEQTRSAKLVDVRTDIWALGLILAECLSGLPVFEGKHPLAVLTAVAGGAPPNLHLGWHTPSALKKVIRRCLQKDPADRYQSVGELTRDLLPFVNDGSLHVSSRLESLDDYVPAANDALTLPQTIIRPSTRVGRPPRGWLSRLRRWARVAAST